MIETHESEAIIHDIRYWGNDHDVTNFCVTDKALVVNSSGRNTTMGGTFTLNDELRINRPAGRLDYQLLYVQYGESPPYAGWKMAEMLRRAAW